MKAVLTKESRSPNPLFSAKAKRDAKRRGETYDTPMYIDLPIGYEVEGPHVWGFCCPGYMNEPPFAEPVDKECRDKVRKWMEKDRPQRLDQIRQMLRPANLRKMSKKQQQHIQDLARVYGLDELSEEPVAPVLTQDLDLDESIKTTLIKAGLNTVPKITAIDDLTKVPNIGKESSRKIHEALAG